MGNKQCKKNVKQKKYLRMKIVVTGTRGIPEIQGGVETHCQELYPRLAALGHDVTVICRSPYVTPRHPKEYRGVKLAIVKAPHRKSFEAIVHTWRAIRMAKRLKADVVHIHAIGPALLTPFARLMGLRVVNTNHGPDYDRKKWGPMAKLMLRTGERLGARYANEVIVISQVIANILAEKYQRTDTNLIFNGVNKPQMPQADDYIKSLGLEPQRYVVALGRFVEEKGFDDLIAAWKLLNQRDYKLVIAGDADIEDAYSRSLKKKAAEAGVVLTGFIRGEKLQQIMGHAALFAMPSYHEGLPIALLEAMSYGLDVAVSSIPANRLPQLRADDFFEAGDARGIASVLKRKFAAPERRIYDLSPYDWDFIARQTEGVYRKAVQ